MTGLSLKSHKQKEKHHQNIWENQYRSCSQSSSGTVQHYNRSKLWKANVCLQASAQLCLKSEVSNLHLVFSGKQEIGVFLPVSWKKEENSSHGVQLSTGTQKETAASLLPERHTASPNKALDNIILWSQVCFQHGVGPDDLQASFPIYSLMILISNLTKKFKYSVSERVLVCSSHSYNSWSKVFNVKNILSCKFLLMHCSVHVFYSTL